MRVEEWSLVGLWCVLIPAGIVAALRAPRRTPGRARSTKLVSLAMVLMGIGTLCDLLPRLLGWPSNVGMALSTVALVLAGGMAVLLAVNLRDFARSAGGQPGPAQPEGSTVVQYGDHTDEQ